LKKTPEESVANPFMTDKILVLTTCPSPAEAQTIARRLLEARLAACVQILPPMQSLYHWQGKIEDSSEFLVLVKTSRPLFDRVRHEIAAHHTYSEPEIVALPIIDGAPGYLDWLDRELCS
jgi:periplasmic divalent cation tolerance protein